MAVLVLATSALACGGGSKGGAKEPEQSSSKGDEGKKALSQAIQAEEAGKPAVAEERYERALELQPESFETVRRYTRFLLAQRRADKAVQISKQFLEKALGNLQAYHLLADAQIAAEEHEGAYETLSSLIELEDKDASAFAKRGLVQVKLEKFDEGFADLAKAIELDGDNPDYRVARGEALLAAGKPEEADKELREAIAKNPKHGQAHLILGMVLREQGDKQGALKMHEQAVELMPSSGKAYFELGVTQNFNRKNQEAEQSLKRATELEPGNAQNWYAYGELLRALERFSDAVEPYRKAIAIDPEHPKAANKLGLVLVTMNDPAGAEAVLTEHTRRNPDDAASFLTLAEAYTKQEKYRQAVEAYERFLTVAPKDDPGVAKARQQIRLLKRKAN